MALRWDETPRLRQMQREAYEHCAYDDDDEELVEEAKQPVGQCLSWISVGLYSCAVVSRSDREC